ncbi:hypothetical protein FDP41_011293 [Naegleria fowleri]|uniref:Uncharacterized protein n=1 Tax=Naegleria fowleri TaxID=5763 RepID=A0A6A5BWA2_NAEFO|nr:uncharacterized protein FDP41_011293 [Naegleria fowleri]KAF0982363.1 hypothetical protein FDP41_011293 [Naegleria fowleri]
MQQQEQKQPFTFSLVPDQSTPLTPTTFSNTTFTTTTTTTTNCSSSFSTMNINHQWLDSTQHHTTNYPLHHQTCLHEDMSLNFSSSLHNDESTSEDSSMMSLSPTPTFEVPPLRIDKHYRTSHKVRLQSLSPSTPTLPISFIHCSPIQEDLNCCHHSSIDPLATNCNNNHCPMASVTSTHLNEMCHQMNPAVMSFDEFLKINSMRYSSLAIQNQSLFDDDIAQKRKRQSSKEDREEEKEHHHTKMTKSGFSTSSFSFFH